MQEVKYQEKLDYLMSLTPKDREMEFQSRQNSYLDQEGDSLIKSPEAVELETNNDMLTAKLNDLVLPLPSSGFLTDTDKTMLIKWYKQHQPEIVKQGLYLGVILQKKDNVSMGSIYRTQYLFYMDAMRVLTQLDPDFSPSLFIQKSPGPILNKSPELLRFRIAPIL